MRLYLVHHGDAVGPEIDPARPLSPDGRRACEAVAAAAAARSVVPAVIWHSGKLRAKQTAEIFWRACNPLAEFAAVRDLQPDDQPRFIHDRLRHVDHDVMLVGHFPYLGRLLELLIAQADPHNGPFPLHGFVALEMPGEGERWVESFRLEPDGR